MSISGNRAAGPRTIAFKLETIAPIRDDAPSSDPIELLGRQLGRRHTNRTLLHGRVRREHVESDVRADYAILMGLPGVDVRQSVAAHTARLWDDFDAADLNDRLRLAEVRSFSADFLGRIALTGIWHHFTDHTSYMRELEFDRFLLERALESDDLV